MKAPAFQFYAKDFLAGTMTLSLEPLGAYIKLLAWSWDNGAVPSDEKVRANILGVSRPAMRRVWASIGDKWVEQDGGGYINLRLEQQRRELESFTDEQSRKGRLGALRKWQGHRPANGKTMAEACPSDDSAVCVLQTAISKDQEPKELASLWNDNCGTLPKCIKLTPSRLKHASSRLSEMPIDEWRRVILRISASKFCNGENTRGWCASFDWLLRPDTATKVLEGAYDDRKAVESRLSRPRTSGPAYYGFEGSEADS